MEQKYLTDGIWKDEKVFTHDIDDAEIFRRQDNVFFATLPDYLAKARALGCGPDYIREIEALIDRVAVWRMENPGRCKVPD